MPRLWQRQPEESPADFAAFVAYLRLKGRRSHRAAAARSGRSLGAIRRLSARFNWPGRVAAYEARLADATQNALDAMVRVCASRSQADFERFRTAEFQLARRVRAECDRWLKLASDPRRRNISLTQVCRLIELSVKLGRLSAGMPTGDEHRRRPRPEDQPGYWTGPTAEEALARIYSNPPTAAPPGPKLEPAASVPDSPAIPAPIIPAAQPPAGNPPPKTSSPPLPRRSDPWSRWAAEMRQMHQRKQS